jgi:hypothetical protein
MGFFTFLTEALPESKINFSKRSVEKINGFKNIKTEKIHIFGGGIAEAKNEFFETKFVWLLRSLTFLVEASPKPKMNFSKRSVEKLRRKRQICRSPRRQVEKSNKYPRIRRKRFPINVLRILS